MYFNLSILDYIEFKKFRNYVLHVIYNKVNTFSRYFLSYRNSELYELKCEIS